MRDLIERQDAIEVIDAVFPVDPMQSVYAQGIARGVALAKTYVEQLPSAQPERKKGEWIPKDDGRYHCSSCDGIAPKGYRWDFCPNCGADMRGGQNG